MKIMKLFLQICGIILITTALTIGSNQLELGDRSNPVLAFLIVIFFGIALRNFVGKKVYTHFFR